MEMDGNALKFCPAIATVGRRSAGQAAILIKGVNEYRPNQPDQLYKLLFS